MSLFLPPKHEMSQQAMNQLLADKRLTKQVFQSTITPHIRNNHDRQFLKRISTKMLQQLRRRTTPLPPTGASLLHQATGGALQAMPQVTQDRYGRPVPLSVSQKIDLRTKIVHTFLQAMSQIPVQQQS